MHVSRRKALIADLLLFSVAVFWGANFAVIKTAVERTTDAVSPVAQSIVAGTMLYLLLRYVVAAGVLAAVRPGSWLGASRRDWAMGAALAAFYLAAIILQTLGLQRTSPGVSGFITGMSVVAVPFLYWFIARRSPGRWQIIGAVVATVGLATLSLRAGLVPSWGDSITLVASLLYAMHVVATGFFAPRVRPATLAMTQIAVSAAALAVITPFLVQLTLNLPWQVWVAVVWTALSGTVYAFFIQSWAQRYTTSTHAAIVMSFESVFAAITGVAVGMDALTWRLLVGGVLMFGGVLIVELLPSGKAIVEEIEVEEGPPE